MFGKIWVLPVDSDHLSFISPVHQFDPTQSAMVPKHEGPIGDTGGDEQIGETAVMADATAH